MMKPYARRHKKRGPARKPENYRQCRDCKKHNIRTQSKDTVVRCGRCARLRREANGWRMQAHPHITDNGVIPPRPQSEDHPLLNQIIDSTD